MSIETEAHQYVREVVAVHGVSIALARSRRMVHGKPPGRVPKWLRLAIAMLEEREHINTLMGEAGFCLVGTGGGCVAWERRFPDGSGWIWITQDDGVSAYGRPAGRWLVGRYSDDADSWVVATPRTLREAIATADVLPDPAGRQDIDVEIPVPQEAPR